MSRAAFVICGMHRSGTSALSRALSFTGAALPDDLMRPQADNPTGFWESSAVVRFNDGLLRSLGRSWADPRPVSQMVPAQAMDAIAQARRLINAHWPGEGAIVLKDPRISRLGRTWIPALQEAGFSPRLILALRHPDEVAASLHARNGIAPEHGRLLWLTYVFEAWRNEDVPRAVVGYADLLADWRSTIGRLATRIDANLAVSDEDAPALQGFLSPELRHHHSRGAAARSAAAMDPDLIDRVYAQLEGAAASDKPVALRSEWDSYQAVWTLLAPVWEQKMDVAGVSATNGAANAAGPAATAETGGPAPSAPEGASSTATIASSESATALPPRPRIVHYHLFKNAGTSVDRTLKANFGATWVNYEGDGQELRMPEVRDYLIRQPWATVLSSHKALLPVPQLPDTVLIPVIFVRHPLDRIRSVYDFEQKQQANTDGATAAKRLDLRGYVNWRLTRKRDRAIANFQTYRLSQGGDGADELARATDALAKLPFIGLVEAYDASLQRLQALLVPHFPRVNLSAFHVNATKAEESSLAERLAHLKERLGAGLYEQVEAANQLDMQIWQQVRGTYKEDEKAGTVVGLDTLNGSRETASGTAA